MVHLGNGARLTFLGMLLLGCRDPMGGEFDWERQLARIRFFDEPMDITVPSTATTGVTFDVLVQTFGDGCVMQGDTQVIPFEGVAEVRPYDHFVAHLPRNGACTSDLRHYEHRAAVTFTISGPAVVRVRGRSYPGDDVIVQEYPVLVR